MNYFILSILESKARSKKYTSNDMLKKAIVYECAKIPADHIRAVCDSFLDRLKATIKGKGGQIEPKCKDSEFFIYFFHIFLFEWIKITQHQLIRPSEYVTLDISYPVLLYRVF